ncbi:hypothetical protein KFL_014290020 [Klebsormidium nitens]|uniref:Uncharacterized protein n=1 Tax=Klebsormidium nitens TaxID=105231 RepID=A0A1Y1IRK7_KLENI|nr:hypothetical protein KFL_014290020 [Klebsormidium nitens]|eukprot:GAQ93304.1 hypothetical protein KFL_014290020 [Klebsormidium nitens]
MKHHPRSPPDKRFFTPAMRKGGLLALPHSLPPDQKPAPPKSSPADVNQGSPLLLTSLPLSPPPLMSPPWSSYLSAFALDEILAALGCQRADSVGSDVADGNKDLAESGSAKGFGDDTRSKLSKSSMQGPYGLLERKGGKDGAGEGAAAQGAGSNHGEPAIEASE